MTTEPRLDESDGLADIPDYTREQIENEEEAEREGYVSPADNEDGDSSKSGSSSRHKGSEDPWIGTTLEGKGSKLKKTPADWPLNDFGIGVRISNLYHHRMRAVGKFWWLYSEGVWVMEEDKDGEGGEVGKDCIWSLFAREGKFYSDIAPLNEKGKPMPSDREKFKSWCTKRQTATSLSASLKCARSEPRLRVKTGAFDFHPEALNVANGVLTVATGTLAPHDPELLLTKKTRAAWRPGAECPTWDKLMARQFPDEKERAFAETVLAYASLLEGNPRKKIILLLGKRDSGKSRVVNILKYLLGTYAKSFEMSLLRGKHSAGPRPDLALRLGCRLLITAEAEDGGVLRADVLKRQAGEDEVSARMCYANTEIERVPGYTLMLALNSMPEITGADLAFAQRLWVLNFDNTVPDGEMIKDMAKLLEAEADGILYRLVTRLQEESILDSPPARFLLASAAAFNEANKLLDFIDSVSIKDESGVMSNSELGKLYQSWCYELHIPERDRLNDVHLGRELAKLGWMAEQKARRYQGKVQRVRVGRRMRTVAEGAEAYLEYADEGLGDV